MRELTSATDERRASHTPDALALLCRAWRVTFGQHAKEKILPADRDDLATSQSARANSYDEFLSALAQKRPLPPLHTALIPQPFLGRPESAKVILLMLNPGLGPIDYYSELSENRDSSYIDILQKNLRGDAMEHPFFFLNPALRWHPGAEYWHRRLGWLIDAFVARGFPPDESCRLVSQNVCCIQSLPYHSTDFGGLRSLLRSLPSAQLAVDAARALATDPNRLTIVMRNVDFWQIPESDNVRYASLPHRRNAAIPEKSEHGKAMLQRLLDTRSSTPTSARTHGD